MRVISSPVSAAPLQPVRAPEAAGNRTHRDRSPTALGGSQDVARASAGARPAISGDYHQFVADQGVIGAGVTAQKVFHAVYGGRPETSLTEASRAYTNTDSLRFRETPFSLRVV